MLFQNFKFDPDAVAADVQQKRADLRANKGLGDLAGYAARVIRVRLQKAPAKYREFGPYWWAVKKALNEGGADLGSTFDVLVASEYTGKTPEETYVMAEAFKDLYRSSYFVGNNLFQLVNSGTEDYELFDPDMEGRAQS